VHTCGVEQTEAMGYALSKQMLRSTYFIPQPPLTEKNLADQTGQVGDSFE